MTIQYDLQADWMLLHTCNYRCSYCFFSTALLGSKLRTFASSRQWKSAFNSTGFTWLLHITGGEPSIYPEFADLCEYLTERHYISVNTNLTNGSLLRFAERIDPARVSFINAGFHLDEREKRLGHGVFLRHADLLRSKGFRILISMVATPNVLARFAEAVALFEPVGLFPVPKLFRGRFEGRIYPTAYSALDKERFRSFADRARISYLSMTGLAAGPPTIDMFNDDNFLDGIPSFRGRLCEAGHRFVNIQPNGDVYRCAPITMLGNVLEGTFSPRIGAAICDTQYCYYFCNKYSRPPSVAPSSEIVAPFCSPSSANQRVINSVL